MANANDERTNFPDELLKLDEFRETCRWTAPLLRPYRPLGNVTGYGQDPGPKRVANDSDSQHVRAPRSPPSLATPVQPSITDHTTLACNPR